MLERRDGMEPDSTLIRMTFAICTAAMLLLSSAAWRRRSTPSGKAHLFVVGSGTAWSALYVAREQELVGQDLAIAGSGLLFLVLAVCSLRLATLCALELEALSARDEALIGVPALAVGLISEPRVIAFWCAVTFGVTSWRWSQLPLRSWEGFRTARTATSAVSILPGLLSVAWLFGASPIAIGLAGGPAVLIQAVVLFYAMPRLGLSSSDRVLHSTVIEAMSDGVLVVDLQGRLIDFNQAAREILEIQDPPKSNRSLSDVLAHHPDLIELFNGAIDGRSVYTPSGLAKTGPPRTFDLQLSALYDATGSIESRVVVLRDISDRVGIEEDNRRQARHVRLVHEVSAAVHEANTIESGLRAALALIGQTMEYPIGQFLEARDEDGISKFRGVGVYFVVATLERRDELRARLAMPVANAQHGGIDETSAAGSAARPEEGAPVEAAPGTESAAAQPIEDFSDFGYQTALTVPVLIGPRLYGLFEFYSQTVEDLDETTMEILEHVGDLAGRAIERKLAEEKIRRLAYRDDLTGLPNRQRFNQLLTASVAQAERGDRRMALLFMDLDGFKQVNDSLGHEAGDFLLAEVASRFSGAVRAGDHIASGFDPAVESPISRLGGDEFTVLLTEIREAADAAIVAERLLATLEHPIEVSGQELFIGTSIGIAIYPEDGLEADRLLRNADAAMYFAKGRGRNGYQFYSEEMNTSRARRLELEARLRGAVERGDFHLNYQPILDARTGEVIAAEALLRWVDSEWGFVSPEDFIPVAEETGLIVSIGEWVFRTACEQNRRWQEAGFRPIRIGVNVSGHQIREPGMLDMVRRALSDTGMTADQMELELTESTIMQNDQLTERTVQELKHLGLGLSLDDFGTGYSSLSYLRRFPIDRVKIDRSFISELLENPDDASLTSAIIAMAHGLRLKVVAEGVETAQQALFLEDRECDELQGYLFSRPCPAEEFEDLLRAAPRPIRSLEKDGVTD